MPRDFIDLDTLYNGLVPSGNKPSPDPMLTHIYSGIYGITRY